ncbi:hypothetical protein [Nocardia veterana]|uniref:Uncharacterized protein n=1 Tax=Nocardia veterana TaxID=132249 RepID=A0A7X6M0I3_9NOCA|nr:hypothetical protein [Nocardia veterana]NKY87117.1 hypothetical protein [Nocardia veterana]
MVEFDSRSAGLGIDELFGGYCYGVRIHPLDDGYGWVAYGHPPRRRIVAAILRAVRQSAAFPPVRDTYTYADLCDGIERWWVTNLLRDGDGYLSWRPEIAGYPGAVPITTVTP